MIQRSALAAIIGLALLPGVPASALEECGDECAEITMNVDDATASVTISFSQGPDDGAENQGNDDVAAVAFTVGIPGEGSDTPLSLRCNGGQLDSGAVVPSAAIADSFALVVENAECNGRERCLCPEGNQQRDNFVNIVVYGPKDLPEGGPVQIPELPSGELVRLNLIASPDQNVGDMVDLRVYCEQNEVARPQFSANLSLGDQSAIDQTANRDLDTSKVDCSGAVGKLTVQPPPECGCVGDCDGNGSVSIGELITGVNIALELRPIGDCPCFDVVPEGGDGVVGIGELIQAVNRALDGCI
jgi:hypothetical protein